MRAVPSSSVITSTCTSEFWRRSTVARWNPNTSTARRNGRSRALDQRLSLVRDERRFDDGKIGLEFFRRAVRLRLGMNASWSRFVGQISGASPPRARKCRSTPSAIMFVLAVRIVDVRFVGKRPQLRREIRQAARTVGSLDAQFVDLAQIVLQRHLALPPERALAASRHSHSDCRRGRRRSRTPSGRKAGHARLPGLLQGWRTNAESRAESSCW